jgi:hypothetical protein
MLKIITENENKNFKGEAPLIEGYIVEVLRREYLNIIEEIDIEPKQAIISSLNGNNLHQNENNKIFKKSNSDNFNQNSILSVNSLHNNMICKSIEITKSTKPQVLKIQQIPSKPNTVLTAASPSKPIIYMSSNSVNTLPIVSTITPNQSPIKQNKLIKISTQLNSLITQNTKSNFIKTQTLSNSLHKELDGLNYNNNINNTSNINKDNIDNNSHSTQVLNLVLVSDSINGGLSYLSLVPSSNNNDNNIIQE